MQRTSLWYKDVQRVKFVVNATYFTVVQDVQRVKFVVNNVLHCGTKMYKGLSLL